MKDRGINYLALKDLFQMSNRRIIIYDLLQICSPECAFGSKWWVGICLGLNGSLGPVILKA